MLAVAFSFVVALLYSIPYLCVVLFNFLKLGLHSGWSCTRIHQVVLGGLKVMLILPSPMPG